jgi:hypothetical protein
VEEIKTQNLGQLNFLWYRHADTAATRRNHRGGPFVINSSGNTTIESNIQQLMLQLQLQLEPQVHRHHRQIRQAIRQDP